MGLAVFVFIKCWAPYLFIHLLSVVKYEPGVSAVAVYVLTSLVLSCSRLRCWSTQIGIYVGFDFGKLDPGKSIVSKY